MKEISFNIPPKSTTDRIAIPPETSVSGSGNGNLTQIVKAIVKEFNVSLRTAYRHVARGTQPESNRRIGRDGKTYPAHHRDVQPDQTPLQREMAAVGDDLVNEVRGEMETKGMVATTEKKAGKNGRQFAPSKCVSYRKTRVAGVKNHQNKEETEDFKSASPVPARSAGAEPPP